MMIKALWLNTNLVSENSVGSNNPFKEMLSNMRVYCRQGIIQEIDIRLTVRCPGQAHTLLLSS